MIIKSDSYNTKESIVYALKLLYIYIELFKIDLLDISLEEARRFKRFLHGIAEGKGGVTFQLNTSRSDKVVDALLGVYRGFYEYLGRIDSPFHLKRMRGDKAEYVLQSNKRYTNKRIPRYIKPHQFNQIIRVIRKDYTVREEVIVRLMFECGMRIGEVLGLTIEDIDVDRIHELADDQVGQIIIRNRLTDKSFQCAKTCEKVKSRRTYKSKDYLTEGSGFQKVSPSVTLLKKMAEYIDSCFEKFTRITEENYLEYSKADQVTGGEYLENGNFYIFLNKDGKPLGISGWNKVVREIFLKAGLELDVGSRKHNLNHRFRHGYAMYLKVYEGYGSLDMQRALRHDKIESVEIYFRPDEEDEYQASQMITKSMYELCPLLKE